MLAGRQRSDQETDIRLKTGKVMFTFTSGLLLKFCVESQNKYLKCDYYYFFLNTYLCCGMTLRTSSTFICLKTIGLSKN